MGTWAIHAAAHTASTWGISTRIRRRVDLILVDMLGDDDEEPDSPEPAPAEAGQRIWPKPPPESMPYPAPADSALADSAPDDPAPADSGIRDRQRARHVPRHAAPSASFTARLSSVKLPGFAPKSSHAAW